MCVFTGIIIFRNRIIHVFFYSRTSNESSGIVNHHKKEKNNSSFALVKKEIWFWEINRIQSALDEFQSYQI